MLKCPEKMECLEKCWKKWQGTYDIFNSTQKIPWEGTDSGKMGNVVCVFKAGGREKPKMVNHASFPDVVRNAIWNYNE